MMDVRHFIGQTLTAEVDRPLGSRHPQHAFLYPLNYGFIPGTLAPDGEALDCYILGVFEPLAVFTGTCIAVLHRRDDDDDKLVLTAAPAANSAMGKSSPSRSSRSSGSTRWYCGKNKGAEPFKLPALFSMKLDKTIKRSLAQGSVLDFFRVNHSPRRAVKPYGIGFDFSQSDPRISTMSSPASGLYWVSTWAGSIWNMS